MNFARALVRDLVDKRLWPVAVLLVAALIAVPLLLGSGGADEGSPAPAAAVDGGASPTASQTAAVQLVGPPSVRSRPGTVRDPFRRPPKVEEETASTAEAAAPTGSASKDDTTTPPDSTTPSPSTQPADPVPVAQENLLAYRTEVRFGAAGGDREKARGISRLTPLGGLTEPALLYIGVSAEGGLATFLLGPTANATGERTCADEGCRIIGLKAGESMAVEVGAAGGTPRKYSLEVVSVERRQLASERLASKARSHVHPDGRDVLRNVIHDRTTAEAIGTMLYVRDLGVVVKKAAVDGTATGGTPLAATGSSTSAP